MEGRAVTGEGTVYRRTDGRWVAAAWVPTSSGTIRRVFTYSKTRAEAKKKLRELFDRADRHVATPPANLTVAAYLAEWLVHVKQHVRPSTWKAYEANTRLHIVPRIGRTKLARLSPRDVRLMLDDLRKGGAGARTIQYVHATLRVALEHAYREELVTRNVVKLVRVESPRPAVKEPLSIEEARNLLVAIEDERNHVLWTTMLMLGLRRSEVCGLRWEDIDFEKQTLRVAQSVQRFDGKLHELPTKTRRSNRTIPLPPRVLAALTEHALGHNVLPDANGGHGYVFGTRNGTPLEPRNLTRMWTNLCASQNLRRLPLHSLRHTCVSLLLSMGVHPRVVMEIVGHSGIEVTMNVYGHINLETQRRALNDLDHALS